ncbi:MAG: amidophosphoribosyltransferase [Actinomycetota bacterium]|nr:amidophosphoribosyltransferase [Actinomycetota bacterium]MDK1016608.1 amidophosphoribosyltransferase [Actinomycetota bacterium]MDK1026293.1 amidophosphoribosyltransferase [Actinomycetota bacterium]MDK1037329.1 amidophosphoribosyltransferase [Actinomycetota bacterium]MDK1096192.1 amidophosphoribosyltransferase [Actinomycetota bacterium]
MSEHPLEDPTLSDRPGEACGVFGILGSDIDAARLTYFGLFALQHRGQESAGISVSDGKNITVYKDLGLVAQVFDEATLAGLSGPIAVGHTRYSTTGSNSWENSQPVFRHFGWNAIALSHNGNLTNTSQLAGTLGPLAATTDSELMTEVIAQQMSEGGLSLPEALSAALPRFEGAFTLTVMDTTTLVGVRDPRGFRPLCLGKLGESWILASETAALDILGADYVRQVAPGEMVVIDENGVTSRFPFEPAESRLCLFEFVYFARPDSILMGQTIHKTRLRMGRRLAAQAPINADITVPVPESGMPAAQGFSEASGIPYVDGLVKNRYVGRTFIEPSQSMRERGVRMKLNAMPGVISGRRVVLVDDSIVRGSTTRQLVTMVREAGATEVHLRISSPPYRWPCFYGMDTGDRSTLLAADRSLDEITSVLGADSLEYLELDHLIEATGAEPDSFCTACLSGEYPTNVPLTDSKFLLEGSI